MVGVTAGWHVAAHAQSALYDSSVLSQAVGSDVSATTVGYFGRQRAAADMRCGRRCVPRGMARVGFANVHNMFWFVRTQHCHLHSRLSGLAVKILSFQSMRTMQHYWLEIVSNAVVTTVFPGVHQALFAAIQLNVT